jgi:hypothetical protein
VLAARMLPHRRDHPIEAADVHVRDVDARLRGELPVKLGHVGLDVTAAAGP